MFIRLIGKKIEEKLFRGKAIIIYGPRQVGKTTLLKTLFKESYNGKKVNYISCDDPTARASLSNKGSVELRTIIGSCEIVILDEAQLVENIGITIKLLVDNYPDLQVIATGSSSFDLANKIVEPLTGRSFEFSFYSMSLQEIEFNLSRSNVLSRMNNFLIMGTYPAVVSQPEYALDTLQNISGGFLYKDILAYEGIRKPELLQKILTVIARSQGSEISVQSIANDTDASQHTVSNYIYLLEQAHLIYTLRSVESNDITSIRKKKKYFITDTGMRNSLVGGYLSIETRSDVGQLWEMICVMERIKFHTNSGRIPKIYYWRYNDQEVDIVDLTPSFESAFECTWSLKGSKSKKIPKAFLQDFPNLKVSIVHHENFWILYE